MPFIRLAFVCLLSLCLAGCNFVKETASVEEETIHVLTFAINPKQGNVQHTAGDFTVNIFILNRLWDDKWTVTIPTADNWIKVNGGERGVRIWTLE